MSKVFGYVCVDDGIKDVTSPYYFSSDEAAKRFFITTAVASESPFDNFNLFKCGEFISENVDGDIGFKMISYPAPKPVTVSPSEIQQFIEEFYSVHPLNLENKKLKEKIADLTLKLKELKPEE